MANKAEVTVALAGDTMLGRGVGAALGSLAPQSLFSPKLVETIREADLFLVNLECCISTRGEPWPAAGKRFFFRAPTAAVDALAYLGVDCVSLANNHALDFGHEALLDTFEHLTSAGIQWVGAGPDLARARAPVVLEACGFRLAVVAVTDYPPDFAATVDRPGVAFVDLRRSGVPDWLLETLAAAKRDAGAVLLSPHWGPNMTARPPPHVRAAAATLRQYATLIAGHSAHVFHGAERTVLYDLGDFLDDYSRNDDRGPFLVALRRVLVDLGQIPAEAFQAVRRLQQGAPGESFLSQQLARLRRIHGKARARGLRPDLGLLFLVTLDEHGPQRIEAVPLKLEYCHTRLADGEDAAWIRRRFHSACEALGTMVQDEGGRVVLARR